MSARSKITPQTSFFNSSHRWIEEDLALQGFLRIIGVDEAGRGPLAGPVVAAAVILPPQTLIPILDDSKKLTELQREKLFPIIHEKALAVGVGVIDAGEIDKLNILQATFKAMRFAIDRVRLQLPTPPEQILIDGNRKFDYDLPLKTIVKGDHLSRNIAAASVVAKVTRDQIMLAYHQLYPHYDFASHKGYPSQLHKQRLEQFGPCPIHRFSFKSVLPSPSIKTHAHDEE